MYKQTKQRVRPRVRAIQLSDERVSFPVSVVRSLRRSIGCDTLREATVACCYGGDGGAFYANMVQLDETDVVT